MVKKRYFYGNELCDRTPEKNTEQFAYQDDNQVVRHLLSGDLYVDARMAEL
jgi:hypothetical protein